VGFRFLYRLAESSYADDFLLKGATMFLFWQGEMHRPTKDLDLLGTSADVDKLKQIFIEIAALSCDTDGVQFDLESIEVQPIRLEQTYGGVRITLNGYIGKARIPLQIDIGVGDAVTPGPIEIELPCILTDIPIGRIRCYNRETSFAEKLESITKLGLANSRMKDFYDLAKLAQDSELDLETLPFAIRATFHRRNTEIPSGLPMALTSAFWDNNEVRNRWSAFVRKNGVSPPASDLEATCRLIAETIEPLLSGS